MKKEKTTSNKKIKVCDQCVNCQYIGEGDFICTLEEPVLVMEDFCPTDEFMYCGEEGFEEE